MKIKKIAAAMLAAALMAGTVVPAGAVDVVGQIVVDENGKEYLSANSLKFWTNSDGTLSVWGVEHAKGGGWDGVIPDTVNGKKVTGIDSGAFSGETYATVTIPDSVTYIGSSAFNDCTELTSVTIPNGVTSIKSSTFSGCTSLASVTIPNSVTSVGSGAFSGCTSLTSVTIPDSVLYIEKSSFDDNVKLTYKQKQYSISDLYYVINSGFTFDENRNLTQVIIPEGVTSIGDNAFKGCTGLTSVSIPDSVTFIGDSAFSGCTSLTSVSIPDSVTSISSSTFSGCTSLTSIIIPDSVTSIGDSAFGGCTSLASVTIPNSVTSIGGYAFDGCTSLTSVTIPESVTEFGRSVFDNSVKLTYKQKQYSLSDLRHIINDKYTYDEKGFCIIDNVFVDCLNDMEQVVIPDGVTSIGDSAFSGCTSLASIAIPDGVTSIGNWAFQNCASLTSVTIPDGVTFIGKRAFRNCSSLTSVTIPDSVTSIGEEAFSNCTSLTSVTIPDGVTGFGIFAFDYNVKLTYKQKQYCASDLYHVINNGYSFDESGLCIIDNVVVQCLNDVEQVVIPDSVTSIGYEAFEYCRLLTSVNIPDGVTSIEDDGFYSCTSLTSIIIPNSVTSIGSEAFSGCTSLKSIDVSDENQKFCSIDGVLFNKDKTTLVAYPDAKGTSYSIPEGVTSVGSGAFSGCTSLTSVTIPDSVTSISELAFFGCTSLKSVTIPDGVTSISWNAFIGCTSLKDIYYAGTEEQWKELAYDARDITVHYNYKTYTSGDVSASAEEGVIEEGAQLSVTAVPGKTDENNFTYEISFKKGETEVQPNGTVTVKIPVPEAIKDKTIYVYHVENGKYTDMNAKVENGFVVFATDHFSEYLVTAEKHEETTSDSSDNTSSSDSENSDVESSDTESSSDSESSTDSASSGDSGSGSGNDSPDTGFAGISLTLGVIALAGAAVLVSKKKTR